MGFPRREYWSGLLLPSTLIKKKKDVVKLFNGVKNVHQYHKMLKRKHILIHTQKRYIHRKKTTNGIRKIQTEELFLDILVYYYLTTHCYKLSALIYYLIVSVEVPSQLGGFSAWSHGAEGKVSGLLRVSGASSKPTGYWRNSFSLVVGLRSLFSCQFKIFFGCGPFLKSLLEKKKKIKSLLNVTILLLF